MGSLDETPLAVKLLENQLFMYLGVSLADDCEGRGPGNKVRLDEWNRRLAKLATSIENSENLSSIMFCVENSEN